MQPLSSTPLAAQAGAIAAAIRAEASHQALKAGMVAALHALILSALARLVARLENLVQLWQAGLLPSHPATPASRATPPIAPHNSAPSVPGPREPRTSPASIVRHRDAQSAAAHAPNRPTTIPCRAPDPVPEARPPTIRRAQPPEFSIFALHTPSPNCV